MTQTQTQPAATVVKPATATAPDRGGGGFASFAGRTLVLARREILSFFVSPIAYVAMILFLVASGFAFYQDFEPGQPAVMRHLFEWMLWFLAFVVPILCMGSISQEWASGTIETLMTAPVSDTQVVLGKFFGATGFVLVLLAPTLLYVVLLRIYATPSLDFGPVFSGYLGMVLCAAMFVAVSLFCSSLTRSQVVAAVSAFAILATITILPWLVTSRAALPEVWRTVMSKAVYARYAEFSKGVVDLAHVLFFLIGTGVFLFLTVKVLESRRWK